GHPARSLRGRRDRRMPRRPRPLSHHYLAAARADDDVRHRDDVDHGVQDIRHGRRHDARRADGILGSAAVRDLPRGLPVLPHGLRGGADAHLPRVRPAVLDPADVRPRAPGPLLMATPLMLPSGSAAARPITPIGARARRVATLLVVHAILIAGAVFILLPFVWMV